MRTLREFTTAEQNGRRNRIGINNKPQQRRKGGNVRTETVFLPDLGECKQGPNPDSLPRCIANQRARFEIRKMAQAHGGRCFLVTVNHYPPHDPAGLREYRSGKVFNFSGAAVAPTEDAELAGLIQDYNSTPFSLQKASARFASIAARLEAIGGKWLAWR